jgi:hypothetical protein
MMVGEEGTTKYANGAKREAKILFKMEMVRRQIRPRERALFRA